MATACFTGLPALTSALMLLLKALGDVDFLSGMANVQYAAVERARWPMLSRYQRQPVSV